MSLRAIIIDDEIDGIRSLQLLLNKFVPNVNVIAESTDPEEGCLFIENYRPDLVFLDINMPGLSGIGLVEKLTFRSFQLIYTTAHREYALKALKLGTTDYLLKPVDAEELIEAVEKAKRRLCGQPSPITAMELEKAIMQAERRNKILISDKETIEYCDPEDIIRLEANSNYSLVVFKNARTMRVSRTLKDFEKQLSYEGSPFMRVHNSHIINIDHCMRYRKEEGGIIQLVDESNIPLSANKKEEFLRRIHMI